VLGPLAEEALRQTLTISRGSFIIFVERPASLWIIGVTIFLLAILPLMNHFGKQASEAEKSGT
jgi:putative tricarboxylic transport membrane protein